MEPGRPDSSLSGFFLKVATHPSDLSWPLEIMYGVVTSYNQELATAKLFRF